MSKKGQMRDRGNGQDRRAKVPRCQHTVVAAVCAAAAWLGSWRTGYPDLSSQHLDRNTADVRVERRRWARLLSPRGSHAARVPDGARVYCLGFAAGARISTAQLSQVLVNRAHNDRPLPNCARDAFDRAVAHIAHREHTRQAGFERQRRAL
jgi:hypothetical protein